MLARAWRVSAMAEFSASLAHELNQPLAAIAANVDAVVASMDGAAEGNDVRRALNDVLEESRRASQIVERTQAMFANRPTERTSVALNELVEEIVQMAQPRLRELDIAIDLKIGDVGNRDRRRRADPPGADQSDRQCR